MGAEYELKFRATEAIQTAIMEDHPGSWQQLPMQTTYYDTPSGSLSARRYMLRKRLEDGVSVCTLKTPGTGGQRGEWEVQCEHITTAVSELCKLDAPTDLDVLCAEGLVSICGAEFTRQILLLQQPGCSAELALDKGRLLGKRRERPLCEVELELKEGSRETLDAFGKAFAEKYGLQPEAKSKFARALALNNEV